MKSIVIKSLFCSLLVLCVAGSFEFGNVSAKEPKRNIFKKVERNGAVHDLCLDTYVPVYIKRLAEGLYFVKVQNRYAGRVRAKDLGEARDIACNMKADMVRPQ